MLAAFSDFQMLPPRIEIPRDHSSDFVSVIRTRWKLEQFFETLDLLLERLILEDHELVGCIETSKVLAGIV
jgi:hypothetical protein